MDDNSTFATSEASQDEDTFVNEVNETPTEHESATEVEQSEDSKLPKDPKSNREALERAFDKVDEKPAVEAVPEVEVQPVDLSAGPKSIKAPASWKVGAREHFNSLPAAVQEEVARREFEIDATLAKTGDERKLATAFMQVAQPFVADLQALGVAPMAAVQQFFNVDRGLRVGSPAQKAQLVAKIIKDYGVTDLDALNDALIGIIPQEQNKPGYDSELAERVARMEQHAQLQQQSAAQQQQQVQFAEIDQFATDPKHEFFKEVANHMLGLLNTGAANDLKSAYDAACFAHPEVRQVLQQREQANKARLAAGSASLTSKGPRSTGNKSSVPQYDNNKDALYAAFAAMERQQRV